MQLRSQHTVGELAYIGLATDDDVFETGARTVKAKRLGRGLSGLIHRTEKPASGEKVVTPPTPRPERYRGPVRELSPDEIRPNPFQPRASFDVGELEELKQSIAEHGILQPLAVRTAEPGYEVIAGERRLRAARELGLAKVPVLVRAATDEEMQTLALVENVQRVDLNPIEKARALKAMMRNFSLTQEDVAERVGKARTTIANLVRILDLPDVIQSMVEDGQLSAAHARAILQAEGVERRVKLAEQAVRAGWSVREVERRARKGPTVGARRKRGVEADPYVADLENRLRQALSTRVKIRKKREGGTIEVSYHNADDLDRLLEILDAS